MKDLKKEFDSLESDVEKWMKENGSGLTVDLTLFKLIK